MNPNPGSRLVRHPSTAVQAALLILLSAPSSTALADDHPDVVVADFEGETYGDWVATGDAFGRRPARGTLPGQMDVFGFLGLSLVNSFHGGDASTGTLTSPRFTLERPYMNFLIGGGGFEGETCLNLLVDGRVVRTATGPNTQSGGSERLDWASWDVSELLGKTATLQVVDRRTGGWGHLNLDHIVLSDRKHGVGSVARAMTVDARYLHLPVSEAATTRRVKVEAGGKVVREFDVKLAEGAPDYHVPADLGPFRGRSVRVETRLTELSHALQGLVQTDAFPGADALYREPRRPQFHFTSRRGWLNDPNGLVYLDGEYHLFYQHNPYGWDWGNMHWGHAVSPDLIHWSELPDALTPREYGDWCFSGSAVVDKRNTSGFGKGGKPPLVLAFTSTGRGECVAFSNDRGRTWTEYEGNPVVKHAGRDPRLLWHEPSKRWEMAVYDETGGAQDIAFYTSPDLKTWTFRSRIQGWFECPDLFELKVEGTPGESFWVLYAADGAYVLGRFDGDRFTPVSGKQRLWHGDFYAAQTFSDTPDGRRIQVGWARGVTFPGMPFNQQMTVPCALTLRSTPDGVRMFAEPVAELSTLRTRSHSRKDLKLGPGPNRIDAVNGDLLDVRAEAEVSPDGTLRLDLRGIPVVYDAARRTVTCRDVSAPLAPEDGRIRLQILLDRGSIEVFGNGGRVALSRGVVPVPGAAPLAVAASGKGTRVRTLDVNELASSWRKPD